MNGSGAIKLFGAALDPLDHPERVALKQAFWVGVRALGPVAQIKFLFAWLFHHRKIAGLPGRGDGPVAPTKTRSAFGQQAL
jgi:hypothetical protein